MRRRYHICDTPPQRPNSAYVLEPQCVWVGRRTWEPDTDVKEGRNRGDSPAEPWVPTERARRTREAEGQSQELCPDCRLPCSCPKHCRSGKEDKQGSWGRVRLQDYSRNSLRDETRPVLIEGPGMLGKTQIALRESSLAQEAFLSKQGEKRGLSSGNFHTARKLCLI